MKTRQTSTLENMLADDTGQNNILSRLNASDYVRLTRTCSSMSVLFKTPLPAIRLIKLPYYLIQKPNDDKVEFILRNNLNLLHVVFKEIVGTSQTFKNLTPLQLVYGVKDEVMCNTLKPFFEELYNSENAGIDEMQRQISEMKMDDAISFDFRPIIKAISNESFNHGNDAATGKWILSTATLDAINTFRMDFDATQPKTIDKNMHFRWETLQELTDAYAEASQEWRYDVKKCALLEDAAFAWVFKYMPEHGAQYCSQGLYYLQKDNPEPFKRMQKTRDGQTFYEALKQQSVDFLLDSSCVDFIYGKGTPVVGWRLPIGLRVSTLQNFCRAKLQAYTPNATTCQFKNR